MKSTTRSGRFVSGVNLFSAPVSDGADHAVQRALIDELDQRMLQHKAAQGADPQHDGVRVVGLDEVEFAVGLGSGRFGKAATSVSKRRNVTRNPRRLPWSAWMVLRNS